MQLLHPPVSGCHARPERNDVKVRSLMMRIGAHRTVIIVLAASFTLFAQSDEFPVNSEDHSSVPDIRQIVESSIAATQRHWQARLHSTYVERDEDKHLDLAGRLKSEDVDVPNTIL